MAPATFQHEQTETSGSRSARLELQATEAQLTFSHIAMGCEELKFELELNHRPTDDYTGCLFVAKASGSINFPNPDTEFQTSDLLLEYIRLPKLPMRRNKLADETFTLILYLATDLCDFLHHQVADDIQNPEDLSMLEALYQLDKTWFRRTS